MMKTIKFRAWDSHGNKMYEWDEICKMDKEGHLSLTNLLNNFINHVKPIQFTGLQDKNGKDIYEGDIVQYKKSEQGKQEQFYLQTELVQFYMGSFGFQEWRTDGNDNLRKRLIHHPGHLNIPDIYEIEFDIEIIGNIHENPELLNKEL